MLYGSSLELKIIQKRFADYITDKTNNYSFGKLSELDSNNSIVYIGTKKDDSNDRVIAKVYLPAIPGSSEVSDEHIVECGILHALREGMKIPYATEILFVGQNFLIFPYYTGGDLSNVQPENLMTPEQVWLAASHITRALAGAHTMGIMHLDVKPANIFCDPKNKRYIMGDWGAAGGFEAYNNRFTELHEVTTADYRCPHILLYPSDPKYYQEYDPKADVWSLGITLLELFLNKRRILFRAAFKECSPLLKSMKNLRGGPRIILTNIINMCGLVLGADGHLTESTDPNVHQKELKEKYLKNADPEFADLICKMLRFRPCDRPSMKEVLEHPFFIPKDPSLAVLETLSPYALNFGPNVHDRDTKSTAIASPATDALETAIVTAFSIYRPIYLPQIPFRVVHALRVLATNSSFFMENWSNTDQIDDLVRSLYNLAISIYDCNTRGPKCSNLFPRVELLELIGPDFFFCTEYEYMKAQLAIANLPMTDDELIFQLRTHIPGSFRKGYLYSELYARIVKLYEQTFHVPNETIIALNEKRNKIVSPLLKKRRRR